MKETVKIYNLDHNGRGIAKINDKVVFVPNALVDEEVDIKLVEQKKNFSVGEVIKHLNESKLRVKPACPFYEECGGCDVMHMTYEAQLAFKENKVKDIITRFAGLDASLVKPIIKTSEFNYRNKITLQVKKVVGFYKRNSYEIVEVDKCLISDVKVTDIIARLNKMPLDNIRQIMIRSSLNVDNKMLVIDTEGAIDEQAFIKEFKGMSLIKRTGHDYQVVGGIDHIMEKLGEYQFLISPDSFFQVNTLGAKILYDQIVKAANPSSTDSLLDLYCGTGTIGIYMSKYVSKVMGIESNHYAIKDATDNAKLNGVSNIHFRCDDVGTSLYNVSFKPDIVIVDPPRAGLNHLAISQLLKISANKLVYVSCDPITLARDLKELKEYYTVNEITPVDMFANTYHVECVVSLTKNEVVFTEE